MRVSSAWLSLLSSAVLLVACASEPDGASSGGAGGAGTSGSSNGNGSGAGSAGCPDGATSCAGLCVDTLTNTLHCGACGTACADSEVCSNGTCARVCQGGTTACAGTCVDVDVDPKHCGMCDKACANPPGGVGVCIAGTCDYACSGANEDCNQIDGDGCEEDTSQSALHCGACGKACPKFISDGSAQCEAGACKVTCNANRADCNQKVDDGCEANLSSDPNHCGQCGKMCNTFNNEFCVAGVCKPVPYSYEVLEQKDIVYQGIGYLLLKVRYLSDTSVAANWCQEYTNLCQSFGFKPTGCGAQFNSGSYGVCKLKYLSDGVSNTLGCNASGGVANAAQQNGYMDATSENSFAFHSCSEGAETNCGKKMCSGNYCNSALSYFDYSKPHGYTLCKK